MADELAAGSPAGSGRVLLVEDHLMMAQALELSLAARGLECRIAGLGDLDDVTSQASGFAADLVLLDLNLGSLDGLQLVAPLAATGARVLIVSGTGRPERLAAALAAGAVGWVAKSDPFEDLVETVIDVLGGGTPPLPGGRDHLVAVGRERLAHDEEVGSRMARLTAREREVLQALAAGHAVQDIARQLFVSVPTVRTHVRAILGKLGVSTQLAAVAMARDVRPD